MNKYYFTFGFGQKHENGFHVIEAETPGEARKEMIDKFGKRWAMQYTESEWYVGGGKTQKEAYNLREIK